MVEDVVSVRAYFESDAIIDVKGLVKSQVHAPG